MTNLLDSPVILATRRNHGLEHATIYILSGHFPGKALAGHSNPGGFFILGDVPTESVREAADRGTCPHAKRRIQARGASRLRD